MQTSNYVKMSMQIDADGVIEFTEGINIFTQVHKVLYGFFNLEIFSINPFSFCIWRNATVLDVIAFKYIVYWDDSRNEAYKF